MWGNAFQVCIIIKNKYFTFVDYMVYNKVKLSAAAIRVQNSRNAPVYGKGGYLCIIQNSATAE